MPGKTTIEDPALLQKVRESLEEIEEEFKDGDLTEKGYWKKKCRLLDPVLSTGAKEKLKAAETDLREEVLTEKGYFKRLAKVLENVLKPPSKAVGFVSEGPLKFTRDGSASHDSEADIASNSTQENGASRKGSSGVKDSGDSDANGNGASSCDHVNGLPCNGNGKHEENGSVANGNGSDADHNGRNGNGHQSVDKPDSMVDADKLTPAEGDAAEDVGKVKVNKRLKARNSLPAENSASPSNQDSPPRRKGRSAAVSNGQQPSITSMFGPSSAKKKRDVEEPMGMATEADEEKCETKVTEEGGVTEEMDEDLPASKRQRVEGEEHREVKVSLPPPKVQARCSECKQVLEDPELKFFQGDSNEAVEEFIALVDPKLQLFTGEEEMTESYDDRPQHKLTHFTVYDKNRHLTGFDGGLLEKNKELFISGFLKPVYEEDPSIEGGIPCKEIGPINEWWTAGFDGGENALIGITTAYADYYLMAPSPAFAPFMDGVKVKCHMSKIVIEFLQNNPDATYEDLLNKLQTTVPPAGISSFTEDSLLRHAQYIVDTVQNYDEQGDDDEALLITTPCMRALIKLAGVTLGKRVRLLQLRANSHRMQRAG
ncbi:DNA (cytosine-5)-methyltransferase PliMCI-like [Littorina saxatilis]|uniref:DNA (cytosine-5)-methyltransferase PliMCI-like n=1 Tax=Littorina saxatilis TaxID=31220 RepID=UPI0038B532CF